MKLTENGEGFPLELIVQIYNINQGRNPEMLKRSENLSGYSFFIAKINEYKKYLTLEEAVRNAVKYCIDHGVLKDFLEKHGSEVSNMLFDEISVEEIVEIRAEEAREEGIAKGLELLRQEKLTIARNLLAEGSTPEFVQKITGLSLEEIAKL